MNEEFELKKLELLENQNSYVTVADCLTVARKPTLPYYPGVGEVIVLSRGGEGGVAEHLGTRAKSRSAWCVRASLLLSLLGVAFTAGVTACGLWMHVFT